MRTVLLVDDHPHFLSLMAQAIAQYSKGVLSLLTAENGKSALQLLRTHTVDLVVTDLDMPGMSGLEVVRHLSDQNPPIPSIVVTGGIVPDVERALGRLGVQDIFSKPVQYSELTHQILHHLATEEETGAPWIESLLDRMQRTRATTGVRVHSGAQEGMLYFVDGELSDATVDGAVDGAIEALEGLEAAREVVSWNDVATEPVVRFRIHSESQRIRRSDLFGDRPVAVSEPQQAFEPPIDFAPIPEPVVTDESVQARFSAEVEEPTARRTLMAMTDSLLHPSLTPLMSVSGALLAVLVDAQRGALLEQAGETIDPLLLAAGYADVLQTERQTVSDMSLGPRVDEMVFATGDYLHILRTLSPTDDRFIGLLLDRERSNLAEARIILDQVTATLLAT